MLNFNKNPIGISISDYSIEIARVNKKRVVESYGRKILNGSSVENGKVKDEEELADILRTLLEEAEIKTDRAIICLPYSRLFFHLFHFDEKLKSKELREKTLKRAEKTIPLETEEVYWDFKKVGNSEEGTDVLYTAARKELLKDYRKVIEKAGLEIVKIEPERIALGRNLLSEEKQEKAIIDLGAKTVNLSVFGKQNELRFVSDIDFGGEDLNRAIAEEKEVSSEKAEQLKRENGLDQSKNNEVLPIVQKELQTPLQELKQAFEYYESNLGSEVERVVLTGGSALLPKIDEYLSMNLNKEVELGDSLINLSDGGSLADEQAVYPLLFSSALGLSLGGLEKKEKERIIDLLPKETEEKKQLGEGEKIGIISKAKNSKWLTATVLALGAVFLGYVSYSYIFKSKPESQPAQEKTKQAATTSTSSKQQEKQEQTYTIVTIQETPTGWLRVRGGPGTSYKEIGRVEPQKAYNLLRREDNWYKIDFSENDGWVLGDYVSTSSTSTLINP